MAIAESHFRPYLGYYLSKHCQILEHGGLGKGLWIKYKISWVVCTWDVREHRPVTLTTILQKHIFDHNFWIKALRVMILVCVDLCFYGQGIWHHSIWPVTGSVGFCLFSYLRIAAQVLVTFFFYCYHQNIFALYVVRYLFCNGEVIPFDELKRSEVYWQSY